MHAMTQAKTKVKTEEKEIQLEADTKGVTMKGRRRQQPLHYGQEREAEVRWMEDSSVAQAAHNAHSRFANPRMDLR